MAVSSWTPGTYATHTHSIPLNSQTLTSLWDNAHSFPTSVESDDLTGSCPAAVDDTDCTAYYTFTYDTTTGGTDTQCYYEETTGGRSPLWDHYVHQQQPQSIYVKPMSPEEKKRQEERRKKREKEQKKKRFQFLKAERKAQNLLKELVSEVDFHNYKKTGYIEVKLQSGKIVRIGRFTNDPVFDERQRRVLPDGRVKDLQVAHLCIHGGEQEDPLIPPTDRVITKLLLAKNNEQEFFKRAHVNPDKRELITDPKNRINFRKTLRAPGEETIFADVDYANFQLMPEPQNIPEMVSAVVTPEERETQKIKAEYPEEFKRAKEELEHTAHHPDQRSAIRIPIIPKTGPANPLDEESKSEKFQLEAVEVSFRDGKIAARKI